MPTGSAPTASPWSAAVARHRKTTPCIARPLLHESSLARTMPTDRILTGRCDTTLVDRGRSSDSRSHSEDGLTLLPGWAPGAKAIADDGLVAEERVLHPALTMVPGHLLPTVPADLLHQRDRPIPRGRPRAVARYVRRLGRWDDDRRTPARRRFVDGDRVIGGVSGDAHERALDHVEQIEAGGRIITRLLGQRVDTDHAGLIDAKVELPPATPAAATVFRGRPLTPPRRWTDLCCQARDGGPRRSGPVADSAANADCAGRASYSRGFEVEAHHPEQGVQEPFGLAQREMVEQPQSQGGLDGEIRVAPLPTPPTAPAGRPGSDRLRGQPHRHIAASNEGLVIGRPVRNAVLRLIRGMNLRLHSRSVAPAEGPEGIVRLIRLDPKNLQSRTIRLQVDATRPGRRLGFV